MYIHRLLNTKLMVTISQKSIIDMNKERESKPHITIKIVINSQVKRAKEERNLKKLQNNLETINTITTSIYLSIITFNVNRQNGSSKRCR